LGPLETTALTMAASRGTDAIAGLAALYSLLIFAPARVSADFAHCAARALNVITAAPAADRYLTLWALRLGTALARTPDTGLQLAPLLALLQTVDKSDAAGQSAGAACIAALSGVSKVNAMTLEPSAVSNEIGEYDADLDDEAFVTL
jgi:hypothetical protein